MLRRSKKRKLNLSKFDLSNEIKTSFEIGQLIPFFWRDVCPADNFRIKSNALVRLMPMLAPVMHRIDLYTRFYFVPYRLLMDNYNEMLTNPDSAIKVPSLYDFYRSRNLLESATTDKYLKKDNLLRSFGIHSSNGNISEASLKKVSQLPFRAYHMIYNYHYKDPILWGDNYLDDMQPNDFENIDITRIEKATYYNDYFTSTLPTTQYGSAVELDMDGNSTILVNEMRTAEKLQSFKEKLLLMGNRYLDYLRTFHGTSPRDETLQRPIYLGGNRTPLNITDVDQTTPSQSTYLEPSPLGNVAGKSVTVAGGDYISYKSDEHGIILGLCYIQPRQSYITGIDRQFIKVSGLDFMNPDFAQLGLQETYGCELDANRSDVFGYNDRYAEYKYSNDVIAGDFIYNDYWHFGRDLSNEQLGSEFVKIYPNNNPFAFEDYKIGNSDVSSGSSKVFKIGFDDGTDQIDVIFYSSHNFLFKDVQINLNDSSVINSIEHLVEEIISHYFHSGYSIYHSVEFNLGSEFSLHEVPLEPFVVEVSLTSSTNHKLVFYGNDFKNYFKIEAKGHIMLLVNEPGTTTYVPLNDYSTYSKSVVSSPTSDVVTFDATEDSGEVFGNHCLMVAYNDVSVLRQLPYNYNPTI